MGLLDFDETYIPPFSPRGFKYEIENNQETLNNLGHKEMSEDYLDEIEKLT